jgi:hypothetical protein
MLPIPDILRAYEVHSPFYERERDGVMVIFLLLFTVGIIELALLLIYYRLADMAQKMGPARIGKVVDHLEMVDG